MPWLTGMQVTEYVHQLYLLQEPGEVVAFFVSKPRIEMVALRVFQIDRHVSHIEVATDHERLLLLQIDQIVAKGHVPHTVSVGQAHESSLRIGDVSVDEVEIGVFGDDHAALLEGRIDIHVVDVQTFHFGQNGRSRITFTRLTVVEIYVFVTIAWQ
jgi:hypothetical protein